MPLSRGSAPAVFVAVVLAHGGPVSGRQTTAKPAPTPAPVVATASVELTDPAGDVQPIIYRESVGSGPEKEVKYPGLRRREARRLERRQGPHVRGHADRAAGQGRRTR